MIQLLRNIIYWYAKGKNVLILFILTNAVYAFMLFVTIPKVMEFAGGLKLLDMMPAGYDIHDVNALFKALGENGRKAYLYNQLPVDMIYPLLFGVGYCLLFAYFLQKLKLQDSLFFYICLLPPLAGISDYVENIGIIKMIFEYPSVSSTSVVITNTFSVVKSSTTTIFFLALIVILILFGINFFTGKKTDVSSNQ